jgi:hypothetical protein
LREWATSRLRERIDAVIGPEMAEAQIGMHAAKTVVDIRYVPVVCSFLGSWAEIDKFTPLTFAHRRI